MVNLHFHFHEHLLGEDALGHAIQPHHRCVTNGLNEAVRGVCGVHVKATVSVSSSASCGRRMRANISYGNDLSMIGGGAIAEKKRVTRGSGDEEAAKRADAKREARAI